MSPETVTVQRLKWKVYCQWYGGLLAATLGVIVSSKDWEERGTERKEREESRGEWEEERREGGGERGERGSKNPILYKKIFNFGITYGLAEMGEQAGAVLPAAFTHLDNVPKSPQYPPHDDAIT